MIAVVVKLRGEYRLDSGGTFIGAEFADSDAILKMGKAAIEALPEAQQPERDALGFVWSSREAATRALAQVTNRLWRQRP